MTHTIYIRGIDNWPDVNVRNQPGLKDSVILFCAPKGKTAKCSEVRPDPHGDHFNGQTYQWFFLTFDDGRKGWARDDLLNLIGDCTSFGYRFYSVLTYAFVASGEIAAAGAVPASRAKPVFTDPEVCSAQVRQDISANVRAEPTVRSAIMGCLGARTAVSVLGVVPSQDNDAYRWVKIRSGDVHGHIREDLLVYSDECATLGLESAPVSTPSSEGGADVQRYGSPLRGGYTVFQEYVPGGHRGIDLAGNLGIGVFAGGTGTVAYTVTCTKCTDSKPNFASHGIALWDAAAIADPSWGYGFGNYVVVRYAWQNLPRAARDQLKTMQLEGAFAYVIYAHLKRIEIADGASVSKGTRLGSLGNTGNSTGPHLHLEVRISTAGNETNLFNRQRIDPRHMFTL